ncbi:HNH endonuclease [Steroidobacter sp.]|uniref:HNH endonuclease n=1 Tax=Steroidobacter sp. TaxID=1978227 RepID=UPI001A3C8DD4|nr:HNH endonuclease signature motif containing protein [Steroidobacter sp.]MBL8265038.1 HNH endonuclease [Steroidobacter sp.]
MTQNDPKTRMRISVAARDATYAKYSHCCAICGTGTALGLQHITPIMYGGDSSPENLILLCAQCQASMGQQPREIEFVSFLAEVMTLHPDYKGVQRDALIGGNNRLRADLIAERLRPMPARSLIIECKTTTTFGSGGIANVIQQLRTYAGHLPQSEPILAIPASLREAETDAVRGAGIELWDLPTLAKLFSGQLPKATPGFYPAILQSIRASAGGPSTELSLAEKLKACAPGKRDWLVYQSLIGDILEWLFYPTLAKPLCEHNDKAKANRRDFIIPNYAEQGFWAFLRNNYQADYVVVDAKNYSKKASKSDVLQIANYLKPHGAGMFGLILSRRGGDIRGCEHTVREQWSIHRKLILILDDEDVQAMLTAKGSDARPRRSWHRNFNLSASRCRRRCLEGSQFDGGEAPKRNPTPSASTLARIELWPQMVRYTF